MQNIRTKILSFIFVTTAFFGPFLAITTLDKAKREESLLADNRDTSAAQAEANYARYQYYLEVNDRKNNLKQAMGEAKNQYEELIKTQPDKIKEKQTTVQQTSIQPVRTQRVIEQKVSVPSSSKSSSTKSSAPKSSTKTKTS